ncbi:MAG TPA: hypothetical protein PLA77_00405 [Bacteroidales bacterium]|nr:hypothetical protein [Bacteroidales bacterium]
MPNKTLFLHLVLLLLMLAQSEIVIGQSHILDKKITVEFRNISLHKALTEIERLGNFSFSYGNDAINQDSIVSIYAEQQTIRKIITTLCGNNIQMLESGTHIILKKVSQQKQSMSGKVINSRTRSGISNARVSNQQRSRWRSDRAGNFTVICNEYPCYIEVTANGYYDTLLKLEKPTPGFILEMQPLTRTPDVIIKVPMLEPTPYDHDSVAAVGFSDAFKIRPVSDTIEYHDLEKKEFQLSVLPFIGSDLWHSRNMKYSTSLNIPGGYVGAVSGVEIGLLLNIVRRNMLGFQFGGLLNIVNGSVSGTQISPGANLVFNHVTGLQAAGLTNYCRNDLNGMQLALIHNTLTGIGNGVQFSLVSNLSTDSLNGLQFSGVSSLSRGRYVGSQISPVVNIADGINGKLQVSAIYNVADESNGLQIAAVGNRDCYGNPILQTAFIFNVANNLQLLQCPALYNRCNVNHGLQLGLINISDSCRGGQIGFINVSEVNSGFAAGFFTVVKNGYRSIEFSYNDLNNIVFCFKSGLPKFYNIINTGISPDRSDLRLFIGYGLGTSTSMGKKWMLNCDLTCSHVFEHNSFVKDLNLWLSLKPQIGLNLANSFILFAGTSLNLSASRWKNPYTNEFLTDMKPDYAYYTSEGKPTQYSIWQGFTIGVRF